MFSKGIYIILFGLFISGNAYAQAISVPRLDISIGGTKTAYNINQIDLPQIYFSATQTARKATLTISALNKWKIGAVEGSGTVNFIGSGTASLSATTDGNGNGTITVTSSPGTSSGGWIDNTTYINQVASNAIVVINNASVEAGTATFSAAKIASIDAPYLKQTGGTATNSALASVGISSGTATFSSGTITTAYIGTLNVTGSSTLGSGVAIGTTTNSVALNVGGTITATSIIAESIIVTGTQTINGDIRYNGSNTTGAGTALLGTNCPASTVSAPYTWVKVITFDGSIAYIPVWK